MDCNVFEKQVAMVNLIHFRQEKFWVESGIAWSSKHTMARVSILQCFYKISDDFYLLADYKTRI